MALKEQTNATRMLCVAWPLASSDNCFLPGPTGPVDAGPDSQMELVNSSLMEDERGDRQ
jgi:hypothetical protein